MKKFSLIVGSIPIIGSAVKNMENLTVENAIAIIIIMIASRWFIQDMWNFADRKTRKRKKLRN